MQEVLPAGRYVLSVGSSSSNPGSYTLDLRFADVLIGGPEVCRAATPIETVSQTLKGPDDHGAASFAYSHECGGSGPELVYKFEVTRPIEVEAIGPIGYPISIRDTQCKEVTCGDSFLHGETHQPFIRQRLDVGTYYLFIDTPQTASENAEFDVDFHVKPL